MTYCSSVEPIGLPVASPKYLAVKFGCSSVFNLCLRRGLSIFWGCLGAAGAIYKEAPMGCMGGPGEAPSRGSRELGMP